MLSFPLPVELADITGNAIVVDDDALEFRGTKTRHRRPGERPAVPVEGKDYRCGWQAAALDDRIARRSVRREKRDVERDGRTIAGCFVGSASMTNW